MNRHNAAMTALIKLAEELESDLDELVIDAKCSEATQINNGGYTDQIAYLLEFGFEPEEIEAVINDKGGD